MLMPVPAVKFCVPGKVWPAAKLMMPVGAMDNFCKIGPAVGPNWRLRLPSRSVCNCADCEVPVPSVPFSCNAFEGWLLPGAFWTPGLA